MRKVQSVSCDPTRSAAGEDIYEISDLAVAARVVKARSRLSSRVAMFLRRTPIYAILVRMEPSEV